MTLYYCYYYTYLRVLDAGENNVENRTGNGVKKYTVSTKYDGGGETKNTAVSIIFSTSRNYRQKKKKNQYLNA